ncbi:MAG: hypothetical protein GXY52_00450 [Chloroflexi bacterium]|nr:hypothetical protein [Chloroflexota bacterium]
MIKLLMTWSIREGKESEYLEFLNREFIKMIEAAGMQLSDAWYQVWGFGPKVMAGAVVPDLEQMEAALASPEWRQLTTRLDELVTDFVYKVVKGSGSFQL